MRGSVRPAKDKQGHMIKGAYDVIYDLPPDPITHKRQQKWKRFYGTRKQADAYLNERIQEIEGGTYREPSKISFGEYAMQWLEDYAQHTKTSTEDSYDMVVKKYLIPAIGHIRLRAVNAETLKNYKKFALSEGKRKRKGEPTGEGLSPTTVNYHFRLLNLIFKAADRERLIPRNPMQDVDPPPKKNPKRSFLSVEQARTLLATDKEQHSRYYVLYLAAVTTGMRAGELLGWRWADINLLKRTARVIQTLEKPGRDPVFSITKSNAGRGIMLVPELATALAVRREQQEDEQRLMGD